ncbi:MAG: threonylcarbamoyl-AMP synthase [Armatimonadetes bacterium]|jgi:L-threonylcarbamoyladenylate synthase|nr:threonylcarbamoyl-AMP synthase [Armatimonadota bacterium]MDI9600802.1 L-threonylcarbamoyladenylate synthase [Acidobacteriota bacterium]
MNVPIIDLGLELTDHDCVVLEGLARDLEAGAVAALPTETVFGLCASVAHPGALARIGRIKRRSADSPLAMFVRDLAAAAEWGYVPDWAERMLADLWPGPLTVVLRARRPETKFLGSEGTVGIRVPNHAVCLLVVGAMAAPLAATSANRSGSPPLATAEEVLAELGSEVDAIVRVPSRGTGRASTVVDLCGDGPVVLREGEIPARRIEAYLRGRV